MRTQRSAGIPWAQEGTLTLLFAVLVACGATRSASESVPEASDAEGVAPTALVALIQLSASEVGDFDLMQQRIEYAKAEGAELVVFPEGSVLGWLNPRVFFASYVIPGLPSYWFSAMAQANDIWIAVGMAERGPQAGVQPSIHAAYDSGLLINPQGEIVLHHRKYTVLKNAFDQQDCQNMFGQPGCSYLAGPLSDITVVDTPFGRTALLVCADAYTQDMTVLTRLNELQPEFVIVVWGVGSVSQSDCLTNDDDNATRYAAKAAAFLGTATVVGANARGPRIFGRFLPAWYCGESGYALPSGAIGGVANTTESFVFFNVPLQVNATSRDR